jgi:hypothetical protein
LLGLLMQMQIQFLPQVLFLGRAEFLPAGELAGLEANDLFGILRENIFPVGYGIHRSPPRPEAIYFPDEDAPRVLKRRLRFRQIKKSSKRG